MSISILTVALTAFYFFVLWIVVAVVVNLIDKRRNLAKMEVQSENTEVEVIN